MTQREFADLFVVDFDKLTVHGIPPSSTFKVRSLPKNHLDGPGNHTQVVVALRTIRIVYKRCDKRKSEKCALKLTLPPSIVQLFPLPVCPYAKMQTL